MKVLVVEDQKKVAGFLKKGLQEEGWDVSVAFSGEQALRFLNNASFDVITLDILLPGIDGLEVLRIMRGEGSDTPVLLLTARDTVPDRVKGLKSGADDYLIKPFAFEELLARLQALVRRKNGYRSEILKAADLVLNTRNHTVQRGGKDVILSPIEFRLLEYFLQNPNHVLSRLTIEEAVWDNEDGQDSNVVDVYVNHLRNKIDRPFDRPLIKTVRGFGYKLDSGDAHEI